MAAIKEHGAAKLGAMIQQNVDQAAFLSAQIEAQPELERHGPAALNIVCFRYVPVAMRRGQLLPEEKLDELNQEILLALQRGGKVYLSNARVKGRFALRACLINFRTTRNQVEVTVKEILAEGQRQTDKLIRTC